MEVENIGIKDVIWNYVATFLQIASGIILLPFILKMMPPETIGIWTIFTTITSLIFLLDFGFNASFTRNISYIFSGVKELKQKGISITHENGAIDYGLLKGTTEAMRWLYSRMALVVFGLLFIFGTVYMHFVLQKYSGNKPEVLIAWIILCIINTYNIYTLYYDSLLQGKGLIKKTKQILIIGQCVYLIVAIVFVLLGLGLISIVSAQAISIVIKRILAHKAFFTNELKLNINKKNNYNKKEIISAIYPNALKLGLTDIGGFLVNKSAIFIGSIYITLTEIASYGVTIQVIGILAGLAGVYYQSYIPKIAQYRTKQNNLALKDLYIRSSAIQLIVFISGGIFFIEFGSWALSLIGSQTQFLETKMIIVGLLIALLEKNHALAAGFLVAKNEVPFFKASLWSGAFTVLCLWLFLSPLKLGLWGMILAQGVVQLAYQNWKWPLVLIKEFSNKKFKYDDNYQDEI